MKKIAAVLLAAALASGCCFPCIDKHQPTPTPTQEPKPHPNPTATPTPQTDPYEVYPEKMTSGRIQVLVNIEQFKTKRPLDYYPFATFMWSNDPNEPALELSIRGQSNQPCLTFPCSTSKEHPETDTLGLVARMSSCVKCDSKRPDEKTHCGEGIGYSNRLPIGSFIFPVDISISEKGVQILTPMANRTLTKAIDHEGGFGLGKYFQGVPTPKGIGWGHPSWDGTSMGIRVRLTRWEKIEPQPPPDFCGD